MAVLDLQRRQQTTGRIRTGIRVKTGKQDRNGKDITRPDKLNTLRFTSPSRPAVEAAALAFGGEVRPWENRGRNEWEVITKATETMVTIPPGAEAISTWYEKWSGGGCERRCDSQTEQKSGGPCLCAPLLERFEGSEAKAKERHRLSKMNPPQACHLKTRINVVLPDLPDVGVWRLDTGSFYAAGEMLGKVQIMEMCRENSLFLPARLWIDHRVEVSGGETKKYPVPVLELQATFRQVATGELQAAGWAGQLPPAPGEPLKAITAARPVLQTAQPARTAQRTATTRSAQDIADAAMQATTREDVRVLIAEAKQNGQGGEQVYSDQGDGEVWETLASLTTGWLNKLPEAGEAA
jgi:hypothetical protein